MHPEVVIPMRPTFRQSRPDSRQSRPDSRQSRPDSRQSAMDVDAPEVEKSTGSAKGKRARGGRTSMTRMRAPDTTGPGQVLDLTSNLIETEWRESVSFIAVFFLFKYANSFYIAESMQPMPALQPTLLHQPLARRGMQPLREQKGQVLVCRAGEDGVCRGRLGPAPMAERTQAPDQDHRQDVHGDT